MRRAGGGSIINTASFVAKLGAATPQIACMSAAMSTTAPHMMCITATIQYIDPFLPANSDTASKGGVLAMTYVR